MKKKHFVIVIITMLLLVACSEYDYAKTEKEVLSLTPIRSVSGVFGAHLYVDSETHVQYFIISNQYGVSITPRYNADGTLRTVIDY